MVPQTVCKALQVKGSAVSPAMGKCCCSGHLQVHISPNTCKQSISEMFHKNKMIALKSFQVGLYHYSLSTGGSEKQRSVSAESLVSS